MHILLSNMDTASSQDTVLRLEDIMVVGTSSDQWDMVCLPVEDAQVVAWVLVVQWPWEQEVVYWVAHYWVLQWLMRAMVVIHTSTMTTAMTVAIMEAMAAETLGVTAAVILGAETSSGA